VIPDELITSDDNVTWVPDEPIHQFKNWPTQSLITKDIATDRCEGAIRASPLYDECFGYTVSDITLYVDSCVTDILVNYHTVQIAQC